MYGDVNVTVEDGNLGRSSSTGSGVQFKIGISNIESTTPILITGSMDAKKIKEKVGNTPLADACIDSVENGAATIYCIPVKATTDGTIGEVKEVKTGEGTLEVSGKPNNAYDIVIKVTDDGENNEAGYAYSLDGGNTFSEEMTVPLNGEAVLANTGLTAKFTEAAGGDSFKEGDTFSFSTTAPSMSNADVISAVESLINNNTAFEYAHIVGTSSRALWASLASIANDFLTKYKRPLFFVCEARMKRSNESLDEYVTAMQEERKGINNIYIQVVCSNSRYQRMDGRVQDINNAGIVCGLYCKAKESQSIGEVKSFPISEAKMLKLLPEGIEDYIAILDKAKYLTFRQYVGKEDYYVTSANMMAPDGSDYAYADDIEPRNWNYYAMYIIRVIHGMMQEMGYSEEQIEQYFKMSGDTTITKTHGRKSVGGINRMVMDAQYFGKKLEKEAKYQWELSEYLNRDICQPEGFDAYGYPNELFKLDMERLGIATKRKPAKVIDFAQYIENNRGTNH